MKRDKLKKVNGKNLNFEKVLKKFNLEHSVAGGLLRVDLVGCIDPNKIKLPDTHEDYFIHLEYVPEEKNYRFSAYGKKDN
jgi:hypothetical protein